MHYNFTLNIQRAATGLDSGNGNTAKIILTPHFTNIYSAELKTTTVKVY